MQGNKNWMRAREGVMKCDSLNCSARELQRMLPIVNENQSDSGALDSVMELLVRSGRDIAEVMMMLIPEAWQNDDLMDEEKKAFYRCETFGLFIKFAEQSQAGVHYSKCLWLTAAGRRDVCAAVEPLALRCVQQALQPL